MPELFVLRADDLLVLRFGLVNLRLAVEGGARLERVDPGSGAWLVVTFQPQHIAEQAFFWSDDPSTREPVGAPPVGGALAGESRLAFRVPDDVTSIPYRWAMNARASTSESSIAFPGARSWKLPISAIPTEP